MLAHRIRQLGKGIFSKDKKLKDILRINQNGEQILIDGALSNPKFVVNQLLLKLRNSEEILIINNEDNKNNFKFTINFNEINFKLVDGESIYDLFLSVSAPESELTEKQKENLKANSKLYENESNMKFYEYEIRLGRFAETIEERLVPINVDGMKHILYKTVKGNISLAINHEVKQEVITQIDQLKSGRHEITLNGKLFTRSHRIEHIKLLISGRELNATAYIDVNIRHLKEEVVKKFGLNRYKYHVNINLNEIFDASFHDDIYDLFFEVKFYHEEEVRQIRVGKPRFMARRGLTSSYVRRDNIVYTVSPYYTFRLLNLSLQVDSFEKESFSYLRKLTRWRFLFRLINKKKDIWIIGERINKAQDTGYHLFKYIREKYPNKNVFYVIDKDSPELKNVEPLGNVLLYRSKEHIKATIAATRIIGSHHPDYLFPLRTDSFKKKVKGKKVFIQHGVMGTKHMVANYGKKAPGFKTDLFLVSSDREKEIIVNDFEYDEKDVVVTGLSRFDSLFEQNIAEKRQILIIPTWREWLVRKDIFLESEYFQNYKDLIHNPKLHQLAKKNNFEIIFCLHPNMQVYTSYFKDAPVSVISQGEVDVQHLLKESALMITDYSSVGFDFSFLNKPIIYYQFDQQRFFGKRGSHLDISNDLPGDIVYTLDDLLVVLKEYVQNDFLMKQENKKKAQLFLKYKDQNSSERIYNAIKDKVRRKTFIEKAMESDIYKSLFYRFRKSKWYFPSMKVFYKIAKKILPVDEKLILFESGIGKQYSDSPRYIYEEIVKRNLDYKKVWVCNKITRFNDPNTIRIHRLSPSYYYYLAKAKYWINNQNFPTYIEKRPQTTYIQTWHGTPLKKMLHDIENVMGRKPDYVERVSSAVKTWDYLISPSKYATNAFKSAFRYEGEIIELGYPRNDIFYRPDKDEIENKIKNRLNLPKDKKIILYAPTFRDNQATNNNRFTFEIQMDLHKMKELLGNEYIILLRMHVAITSKLKLDEELSDFVMDVSNYSDMQELLLVTDILITDYSSVMFDFANTKKPMIFFTYDLETYRDDVRGFYMDFESEAPGPLVRTTDEIIETIQQMKETKMKFNQKYNEFYEKYCSLEDGAATEKIVNRFFN